MPAARRRDARASAIATAKEDDGHEFRRPNVDRKIDAPLPRREFREQNGRRDRDDGNASQAPARIVPVAKKNRAQQQRNADRHQQPADPRRKKPGS
jgi:hypothetical protein